MLFVGGAQRSYGAEYFVSPSGSSTGDGSKAKPYNLTTVLTGSVAQPGDTFWLMGGTHAIGYLSTKLQGAAGRPVTLRAIPGQRATVDGAITHWSSAGYVDFWGLEWTRNDPNRISTQTGFYPTDIAKHNGFNTFVPYVRMINLVIHDQVGSGVYMSPETVGSEIHGCLAYNNGYLTADVSDGHAFYIKNNGVQKTLSDNIAINGIASGFHIFTEGADTFKNIVLDGNVAFNAGIYSPSRGYRDLVLGGDGGQVVVDAITVQNSFLYYKPGTKSTVLGQALIGRDGANGSLTLTGNHFTAGLCVKNWARGSVTGNRIGNSGCVLDLYQNLAGGTGVSWNGNNYQCYNSPATPFRLTKSSAQSLSFTSWKQQTGYDATSQCTEGACVGVECYVRPNKYEAGRANLIVYNWAGQSSVSVDVSSVLPVGTAYEVRNAQNYYATPVLSGVYQGGALSLPMTGLTVAKPNGSFTATAPIGPNFNVFILCPLPSGTPDNLNAASGVATGVSAATLLANDTNLRAPLTLTGVSATSANGGTVTQNSSQISYQSATGYSGADTFMYTVVDALGSVGTGLVTVTVTADNSIDPVKNLHIVDPP
jgi:hypothetical protein